MKDNKLIAEFMGMKPLNNDSSVLVFSTDRGNDVVSIDNLQYQNDWNLLMEVVDKIEGIVNDKGNNYRVVIQNETCIIDNTNIISSPNCASKIQATYKAVVEFIKWYNNESNN